MWKMLTLMLAAIVAMSAAPGTAHAQHNIRFAGVVQEVRDASMVFHTDRGSVEVLVTHDTRLIRNGEPARLGDFQRGDRAHVAAERTDRGLVGIIIEAVSTISLRGIIAEVGDHAIVLHTDRGDLRIGVTEHTIIVRDGHRARLGDLRRGDRAAVEAFRDGHGGLTARSIHARSALDAIRINGTIVEIGHDAIVLRTDRGDVRIAVTERTQITRNGEPAHLEDLRVEDQAHVQARWEGSGHERRLVALRIAARGH